MTATIIPRRSISRIAGGDWNAVVNRRPGRLHLGASPGGREDGIYDAELTSNLSRATNAKTGATTCTARLLVPDIDNPGDLRNGPTITITNRSIDLSGLNGDYVIVAPVGNEWRIVWMDC